MQPSNSTSLPEGMISRIRSWLALPALVNGDSEARRSGMLKLALINVMVILPLLAFGNLLGGKTPAAVIGLNALAFAACLILYLLARSGRIVSASIGLMAMGLVGITGSIAALGTVRAPSTAMYLLMVITAGLLFDLWGMVLTAAICSILVAALILAENMGLLPAPDYSVTITQWITYTAIFGWAGSLTYSALKSMYDALARADSELAERKLAETELQEHRDHLEELVRDRTAQLEAKNALLTEEITGHEISKQALRETRDYLENLINHANAPIIVWDQSFKITRFNRAFERLTGRSAGDVLGQPLEVLFPQGSREGSLDLINRTVFGERLDAAEIPIMRIDGSVRIVLWNSAALYSKDGTRIVSTIAQGQDITQRKQAEEKLLESKDYLDKIINSLSDPLHVKNRQHQVILVNDAACRLFGRSREGILGLTAYDLFPTREMADISWEKDEEVFRTGVENTNEETNTYAPGVTRTVIVKKTLYTDKAGNQFLVGTTQDVTGLKHIEKELRLAHAELENRVMERTAELARSNEMLLSEISERKRAEEMIIASLKEKEALLREIHHRVKNNLQIISSLLYLQSRKSADKHTRDIFQDCQNRIKSMALVHEKLYGSKNLAKVNLAGYIKSLVDYLYQSYDVRQDRLSLRLNIEDIMISADTAIPCGLIINELVSNSLKHAFPDGKKGQICIELLSDGENGYNMVVKDDGIGFEEMPEKANTLGLKLVNTLVSQLDGSIKLDSSKGTKIEIRFRELKYRERL